MGQCLELKKNGGSKLKEISSRPELESCNEESKHTKVQTMEQQKPSNATPIVVNSIDPKHGLYGNANADYSLGYKIPENNRAASATTH